jgi:hypothetical protein
MNLERIFRRRKHALIMPGMSSARGGQPMGRQARVGRNRFIAPFFIASF